MEIRTTNIDGLYVIKTKVFEDHRGTFQKIFNDGFYAANNLDTELKEFYYSISRKNTVRGMHFQTPPAEHVKIVYVSNGSILDISVDLRESSPAFGNVFSIKLDNKSGDFLYLPKGIAHGFKSLEDNTIVNYAQTSCYSKENDMGILYSSIDFDWQIENPMISERDLSFPPFSEFKKRNPFK